MKTNITLENVLRTAINHGVSEVSLGDEIWRSDKDSGGLYWVSNKGRVWSSYRERFITTQVDKDGYMIFHYFHCGKETTMRVHRLVAKLFLPNPNGLPIVEHLDCNPANNNVENLRWSTTLINNRHPITLERLSRALKGRPIPKLAMESLCKPIMQFSIKGEYIKTWKSGNDAARSLGINFSKIAACARKEMHTAGGFVWRREVSDNEWIIHGQSIHVDIRGKFGKPVYTI